MRISTQVVRWRNSLRSRLAKAFTTEARISEGDSVDVTVGDGGIIVSPAQTTYSLHELVSKITEYNRHGETDWGAPAKLEQV